MLESRLQMSDIIFVGAVLLPACLSPLHLEPYGLLLLKYFLRICIALHKSALMPKSLASNWWNQCCKLREMAKSQEWVMLPTLCSKSINMRNMQQALSAMYIQITVSGICWPEDDNSKCISWYLDIQGVKTWHTTVYSLWEETLSRGTPWYGGR